MMDDIFMNDVETDALEGVVKSYMLNEAVKNTMFMSMDEWISCKDLLNDNQQ